MEPLLGHDVCRICGYRPAFLPFGEDGMSASYEFCDSCGVKFGYNDRVNEGIEHFRRQWLAGGPRWDSTVVDQPTDWRPLEQLQQVPDHFRYDGEVCWTKELDLDDDDA